MTHHRELSALVLCLAVAAAARAEARPIDIEQSTLTIFAFKSGMFSAFADDHVIRAPIASGSVSDEAPLSVEISLRSGDLRVLDPDLALDKRAEVQARMVSTEVLQAAKYPEVAFRSTAIEPAGSERWKVTGDLSLHGVTRPMTFDVERQQGRYRGTVTVRQSDFGIEPISIAGGMVKVRDELKVEFDIVAQKELAGE